MKHDRKFIIKYYETPYIEFIIVQLDSHNHFITDELLIKCTNGTFFDDSIPYDFTPNEINEKLLFVKEV